MKLSVFLFTATILSCTASESLAPIGAEQNFKEEEDNSGFTRNDPDSYPIPKNEVQLAVASGDPKIWSPMLHQFVHPKYGHSEVIALYKHYLNDPNLDVRVSVACYLFEIGSMDGLETLREVIKQAAYGSKTSESAFFFSVQTLFDSGQTYDPETLAEAYTRQPSQQVLRVLTLMQTPIASKVVAQELDRSSPPYVSAAGDLRIKTPQAIAIYGDMFTTGTVELKLMASYALYRATEEKEYFDYIVDAVLQSRGLISGKDKVGILTRQNSLDFLINTGSPKAIPILRMVVLRDDQMRDLVDFSTAFSALYVWGDYDFVDHTILTVMNRTRSVQNIDQDLLWQIAAARNTPAIQAIASKANPAMYKRFFDPAAQQPPQTWIYRFISSMPADIRSQRWSVPWQP